MNTAKQIGQIVRSLRGNESLRDFAAKCGLAHSTVDYIEKGFDRRTGKETNPSAIVLNKIATSVGVPLSFILGTEENEIANSTPITEAAQKMMELFNQLPPDAQEKAIPLIEAALKAVGLLE